jgi:Fic family protein
MSPETTLAVDEATASAAGLDKGAGAQLGALGGFLLRSESIATSKIEHIYASRDDFAQALAGHEAGEEARRTAAAVTAIASLVESTRGAPITLRSLNEAHRELLADDRFEGADAGRPRDMQSWIGGGDFTPRLATYVPPPPNLLERLLEDLVRAANRTDLPPIAQAAVVHAQFESIHPYTDGNGRIGRALINAVLRHRELTTRIVVPVASAMLADVDGYFVRLDGYRVGDVDGFIEYLARVTVVAATEAVTSAQCIAALPAAWRETVKPRKGSAADKLLDRVLDVPVLTDRIAAAAADSSVRRIYGALDRLVEAQVLTEITGRERDRVWVASDVLDELDRLEERIGRRSVDETRRVMDPRA